MHVAVVIDVVGRVVATTSVPTTRAGYEQLVNGRARSVDSHRAGVEGTGTYGAGAGAAAARAWRTGAARSIGQIGRRRGCAASAIPPMLRMQRVRYSPGTPMRSPRLSAGVVEAMRAVTWRRRSAVKAKTQAINQLRALWLPPRTRSVPCSGKSNRNTVSRVARDCSPWRHAAAAGIDRHAASARKTVVELGERAARAGRDALEQLTKRAGHATSCTIRCRPANGRHVVGNAGDNPDRLRSEAALAALCGVSPLEASSGKTTRHRLNRGGDRAANNALWTISMVRMRSEPRTRAYVARRTAEGRSTKEIQRCLKRYIVRELYR